MKAFTPIESHVIMKNIKKLAIAFADETKCDEFQLPTAMTFRVRNGSTMPVVINPYSFDARKTINENQFDVYSLIAITRHVCRCTEFFYSFSAQVVDLPGDASERDRLIKEIKNTPERDKKEVFGRLKAKTMVVFGRIDSSGKQEEIYNVIKREGVTGFDLAKDDSPGEIRHILGAAWKAGEELGPEDTEAALTEYLEKAVEFLKDGQTDLLELLEASGAVSVGKINEIMADLSDFEIAVVPLDTKNAADKPN